MSVKQRIECFMAALPDFKKAHENYLINRKRGERPNKNKGGKKYECKTTNRKRGERPNKNKGGKKCN